MIAMHCDGCGKVVRQELKPRIGSRWEELFHVFPDGWYMLKRDAGSRYDKFDQFWHYCSPECVAKHKESPVEESKAENAEGPQ